MNIFTMIPITLCTMIVMMSAMTKQALVPTEAVIHEMLYRTVTYYIIKYCYNATLYDHDCF